ncbi:MAG: glucosamine-6-phosphate deaminase [Bacteroidetes bacterium]|nr:glucosamine-6-phosphate deaminase [Bacteroidota bacterium]
MVIECFQDYESVSSRAAELVCEAISENPGGVFGFATGSTPERLYELLVTHYQRGEISFDRLTTVNLDEYIGLAINHEQSYATFMQHHLFGHVNVQPDSIHFPAAVPDPSVFEQLIQNKGGIDLQILGLGSNGHIGFNEPGSPFDSRTRVVSLAPSTIQDNARFFDSIEDVPHQAVTMGIQTIMEARKILLLACGPAKADAVARCLQGPQTEDVPGSCLQAHSDVTVLLDEAASSGLNK